MTTESRKTQLIVEVDPTTARAGFNEIKQGARDMAQGVAQAGQQASKGVDGIGSSADGAAKDLDRATKNIIASVQRTTAAMQAGSRGTSAYFEVIAKQRGANVDALKPYIEQLRAAEKAQQAASSSLGTMGISAAQTQAALRSIPAQFTDIITSLQGGQAPLTVLLQQGGQLKDMFGGAGAAAKALGSYIAGLLTPFTALAAAAGVVALAYHQGSKEADAYAKALIMTGNAAGTTVGQLAGMAVKVSAASGATQAASAEALAGFAATGRVAAANLQLVADAAISLERNAGVAVADTVKQFVELGQSPADASAKLNEQYGYLTASVYRQIKALEDQGKASEAAALAQSTFANAMKGRGEELKQRLGAIETAWRDITGAAKGAWDAMLGIGRPDSDDKRLENAKKAVAELSGRVAAMESTGADSWLLRQRKQALIDAQAQVKILQDQADAESKAAKAKSDSNEREKAGIELAKEADKYLTRQAQKKRELAKVEELYAQSAKTADDIEARRMARKGIEDKFKDTEGAQVLKQTYANRLEALGSALAQEEATLKLSLERRLLTEREYIAAVEAARIASAQQKEIALGDQYSKTKDPAERLRIVGEMAKVAEAIAKSADGAELALAKLETRGNEALQKLGNDLRKGTLDPLVQAAGEFQTRYGKLIENIVAADKIDEASPMLTALWKQLADEKQFDSARKQYEELFAEMTAGIEAVRASAKQGGGLLNDLAGDQQSQIIIEQYRQRLDELRRTMGQFAGDDPARKKAIAETGREMNKVIADSNKAWLKFTDDIERSLTDSLMRSFESGKGYGQSFVDTLRNTLKTAAFKIVVQAIVDPVMGTVRGVTGLGSSGAGGIGGLASSGGGLSNLYSSLTGNGIGYGLADAAQWLSSGSAMGPAAPGTLGDMFAGAGQYANWEFGLAGLGGGILGGALGGSAGSALGSIGSTVGYAMGGPLGGLIGSIGGGLLGGLFGWDDPPAPVPYSTSVGITHGRKSASVSGPYTSQQMAGAAMDGAAKILGTFEALAVRAGFSVGYLNDALDQTISASGSAADFQGSLNGALTSFSNEVMRRLLPNVDSYKTSSETLADTFARLINDTTSLRTILGGIGKSFVMAGDDAVDFAESVITKFGGLQNVQAAVATYYDTYYSEAEKAQRATQQVSAAMGVLGLAMPKTRDEFRALVDAQDLATEAGRAAFTALIGLAPAFASVTKEATAAAEAVSNAADAASVQRQIDAAASERLALAQDIIGERDGLIQRVLQAMGKTDALRAIELRAVDPLNRPLLQFANALDDLRAAAEGVAAAQSKAADAQSSVVAAQQAYAQALGSAGQSIASYIATLRQGNGSTAGTYASDLAAARNGDVLASGRITGSAQRYLEDLRARSGSSSDFAAAQARVAADLESLPAVKSFAEQQVDYLAQIADANANLTTAVNDVESSVEMLRAALVDTLVAGFGTIDANANGQLTFAELQAGLAGLATDAQIQSLIAVVDSNGDGQLTQLELLRAGLSDLGQVTALGFAALDANANGQLTFAELQAAFAGVATDAQLAALIAAVDSNGDGQISKLESISASTQSTDSNTLDLVDGGDAQITELRRMVQASITNSTRLVELNASVAELAQQMATIAAQNQAAADEQVRQQNLAAKETDLRNLIGQQQTTVAGVTSGVTDIWALAARFGMTLQANPGEVGNTATFGVNDGLFQAQYNQITGDPAKFAAFRDAFYSAGGVFDRTYGMADDLLDLKAKIDQARQAIRDLGGVPQFAAGGRYGGGLALVGEGGPELINFNRPGYVHTAPQTASIIGAGNAALIDEIVALRREVEGLRSEAQATARHTAKTVRTLERVIPDGDALQTRAAA